ncbi:interferon alpha-inducible protein 27-like protein 2A isoform X1 [Takifugu flavidus]|uniref:interferon alpha-inducible protein 27-like protein 2A isoform X1 n=1 Tax=Takifugu flavidus TaxID=433684 RepID=UPI002544A88B|nr:interferon alpha-inducible protein 27-like protein 2A isoform X1 [Takifugu flavidus]
MDPVTVVAVVGGAAATVALAPVALGAAGFTSAGIASGSVAAKLMSVTAVANGGGVAAGSAVAVLQSAGMAGLSAATNVALAGAGAGAGAALDYLGRLLRKKKKSRESNLRPKTRKSTLEESPDEIVDFPSERRIFVHAPS